MRSEHQDASLPWFEHRTRVQLQATLFEVRRRLADPEHRPRPTQPRIPIVVGAMSSPGLRVAARLGDMIAGRQTHSSDSWMDYDEAVVDQDLHSTGPSLGGGELGQP